MCGWLFDDVVRANELIAVLDAAEEKKRNVQKRRQSKIARQQRAR